MTVPGEGGGGEGDRISGEGRGANCWNIYPDYLVTIQTIMKPLPFDHLHLKPRMYASPLYHSYHANSRFKSVGPVTAENGGSRGRIFIGGGSGTLKIQARSQALGSGLQAPGSRLQAPHAPVSAGSKLRAPDSRHRALGSGLQALGSSL